MKPQIAIGRASRTGLPAEGELDRALRPVPTFARAVREVSRMLSEAGVPHALVGALGANAYRDRPRTTEEIKFLVGDQAFEIHAGGSVTLRVPVVEFDGIDVDQVPLTDRLRGIEDGLERARSSEGVPIAPVDTIVVMKLLAGRHQDLADVEAIVESGADREDLRAATRRAAPDHVATLDRLFANIDGRR